MDALVAFSIILAMKTSCTLILGVVVVVAAVSRIMLPCSQTHRQEKKCVLSILLLFFLSPVDLRIVLTNGVYIGP